MKQFLDWLDHRTGIRDLVKEALYENIPGGSRWRYVWGSTLMFALAMQFITGIAHDPDNQVMTRAIASIAEQFDLFTVAESVENALDAKIG